MKISNNIIKLTLLLPWFAVIILGGVLFFRRFPVNGVRVLDIPLNGNSPWFDAFLPGDRASSPGVQDGGWTGQRITQEPVYAGVRLPGAYDRFTIEFETKPTNQPLIEIGLMRGATSSYEMQPLWSELLSKGWRQVNVEGVQGLVRDGLPDRTIIDASSSERLVWHQDTPLLAKPLRFNDATDLKKEGIKAIVTSYAPPETTADGWLKLKASFDLATSGDRLKFSLATPGISGRQGTVDIRNVKILFYRQPLTNPSIFWTYLRRELSAAWHRI